MAVGTEIVHPVSILDGVSKVSDAVSPKERGVVVDNSVEVAVEAQANLVEGDMNLTGDSVRVLPSISEGRSDETLPVTSEKVEEPVYRSGGSAQRGIRRSMEDAHLCVDDLQEVLGSRGAFYGVFDGHDGKAAACYVKQHLLPCILGDASFPTAVDEAVKNAFLELDSKFREVCNEDDSLSSGTTVLTALLQGRNLLVANAGDCRAVLCRRGKALEMSTDHNPNFDRERSRIESVGGYVLDGHVNGQVTVARAIGDWHIKGLKEVGVEGPLSALPDIQSRVLSEEDEFLLMGCDGLWEVFNNDNAISCARKFLQEHNDPKLCSKQLVDEALKRGSQDNVTAIVICFKAHFPPPNVVLERRITARKFNSEIMRTLRNEINNENSSGSECRLFH